MTRLPSTAAILATALACALFVTGCASDSAFPTAEDLPALLAEAAAGTTVPRSQDDPARRAVRMSLRAMMHLDSLHVAEVGARVRRPHLQGYFLYQDSYVGGDFPKQTAVILREIERLVQDYVASLEGYPEVLRNTLASTDVPSDRQEALVAEMSAAYAASQEVNIRVNRALEKFVVEAAKGYELAAANPGAFSSTRAGLEVEGSALLSQSNRSVAAINRAGDELDVLLRSLTPEQSLPFSRMSLQTLVREHPTGQ
ncbi:MAG TPA: hypothetical protein VK928_02310 [Longimicrobiales bacterium]|nr:hypothetical protein [Longimicrobiales bacterium]